MPLIRCPKCGQAYDVPGVVAVRLPSSIATCRCGEWLAGSKAAVLARMLNPDEIKQPELNRFSLSPYFVLNDAKSGVVFRANAGGIACAWMGVGASNPACVTLARMRAESPRSAKLT